MFAKVRVFIYHALRSWLRTSSNSYYGRQPAEIPAEAGTTNAFSLDFTVFVVPPLGGSVHNENCWRPSGYASVVG